MKLSLLNQLLQDEKFEKQLNRLGLLPREKERPWEYRRRIFYDIWKHYSKQRAIEFLFLLPQSQWGEVEQNAYERMHAEHSLYYVHHCFLTRFAADPVFHRFTNVFQETQASDAIAREFLASWPWAPLMPDP